MGPDKPPTELSRLLAATEDRGRPEAAAARHAKGYRTARENLEALCVDKYQVFTAPFFAGTTGLTPTDGSGLKPFTYHVAFGPGVAGNPFGSNSTFSGNAAGSNGGAIYVLGDGDGGTASLIVRNSILANNGTDEGEAAAAGGGVVSLAGSGNLIMANAVGLGAIPGVVTTADPQLGPLQINAPGNTPTMAITVTSPAFGAADNVSLLATDQRGVTRPQGTDGDIGAYELLVVSLELQPPVPDLVDLDPIRPSRPWP